MRTKIIEKKGEKRGQAFLIVVFGLNNDNKESLTPVLTRSRKSWNPD